MSEPITIRANELKRGIIFKWMGSEYKVVHVTDRIYFRINVDIGGNILSFGLNSMQKVAIVEQQRKVRPEAVYSNKQYNL